MQERTKYALWLGFFGFCHAPLGEVLYSVISYFFGEYTGLVHDLYYILIAAFILITAVVFYKLSIKHKLLQRLFEGGIFYAIAKFGNELTSRATSFDNKEIWYWSVLALYTLYRIITIKKK